MAKLRTINTTIIPIRSENRNYAISNKIEYKDRITTLIEMEKYSSLNRLYSVTSFVYRFISNLKNRITNKHENLLEGPFTREEFKHIEHIWIKALQKKHSCQ